MLEEKEREIHTHTYQNAQEIIKDYLRKIKIWFDNIFLTNEDPIDKEN
jgi:hypothetical protein